MKFSDYAYGVFWGCIVALAVFGFYGFADAIFNHIASHCK